MPLTITIPAVELFDEVKMEFVNTKEQTLELEHSLVSLAAWESQWEKPFLSKEQKTREETISYIKHMTLTPNVDPDVYNYIGDDNIQKINAYIEAPMTATTFSDDKNGKKNRETITAEIIYYWMVALTIPPEYQYWHINRLMTLIKVCSIKNAPPKKMSQAEAMRENKALNEARRKQFNSRG